MTDPIAELVTALERDGKPPLAWVVRWSEGGREPVQAAWEASKDPDAMLALITTTMDPQPIRDLFAKPIAPPTDMTLRSLYADALDGITLAASSRALGREVRHTLSQREIENAASVGAVMADRMAWR